MNFSALKQVADAKEDRRQGEQAFTMVEIAIAIGVIAFALVAIIGILPRGMTMQRNERQDTAIAEDAHYFMDAIRNGVILTNNFQYAHAYDFLTNYIISITSNSIYFDPTANPITVVKTATSLYPITYSTITTTPGAQILGTLSTPNAMNWASNNYFFIRAVVRSLNSPATEQSGNSAITAFTYQMDVEILPYDRFPANPTYESFFISTNNTIQAVVPGPLTYNLFDVRLHFRWPVINLQGQTNYTLGDGFQDYRTLIGSAIFETNPAVRANPYPWWFFQPQTFSSTNPIPGGSTL